MELARLTAVPLVLLGLFILASDPWAQGQNTVGGRHFVHSPRTSYAAATVQPVSDPGTTSLSRRLIWNFDTLPGDDWHTSTCSGRGKATVSHGILTIDSPSDCFAFYLPHPEGRWHKYVSNRRGWVIEASLKLLPGTEPDCSYGGNNVQIWAHDHTNLVIIGFSTNEICIAYPDNVRFPMDTMDSFHIYRIESQGRRVQVYVDGTLRIDHALSTSGAGTDTFVFGDGTGSGTSLTLWDYFSYDVYPSRL